MGTITFSNGTLTNGTLSTFSPLAFSPDVWLDSNDLTTVVADSSNKVSQEDDKSGNGNDATQGTPASRPTLVLASLNNKNVINYDRAADNFMSLSYNWPLTFTIFLVIRTENVISTQRILSSFDGAGPLISGDYIIQLVNQTVRLITVGEDIISSSIISVNTPYLITATCTGGSGGATELFVDQVSVGTGTNTSTTATRPISIGEDSPPPGGASEYFDGDIGEIIINSSLLTPKQIAKNEQCLINKWGI